jgi:hypothetical protein
MAGLPEQRTQTNLDRRSVPRSELALGITLHRRGEEEIVPAAIANLSVTGFLAEMPRGTRLPEYVEVDLPNAGRRTAQVVWQGGTTAGCNFTVPLSRADLSAARLKSAVVDQEAHAAPAASSPPIMFQLGPSDPIWDMLNEAAAHEKLSGRTRLAVIAAAAFGSWVPVAGLVALLA